MHCRFINITNGQMLKILKSVDALNPTVMVSRLHEVFQGYYHLKELSVSDKPDGEFVVSKMDGRGCKQLLDHRNKICSALFGPMPRRKPREYSEAQCTARNPIQTIEFARSVYLNSLSLSLSLSICRSLALLCVCVCRQCCRWWIGSLLDAAHAAYRCITVKDLVSGDTTASDGRHPYYTVIDEFERNIRIYHDIVCDKCTTARLMCELEKQGHQYVNWPLHQVMYALLNELMLM